MFKVKEAKKELKVLLVQLAQLVLKVQSVLKVQLELKVLKVNRVLKVQQGLKELLELLVYKEQ